MGMKIQGQTQVSTIGDQNREVKAGCRQGRINIELQQQAEPANALTAKHFEDVFNSGNYGNLVNLVKNAPLGNKLPTGSELNDLGYSTYFHMNEDGHRDWVCGESSISTYPQKDGTTLAVYKNGNLTQTVTYDANGNLKKGEIKSKNEELGFTSAQINYWVGEDGKMNYII